MIHIVVFNKWALANAPMNRGKAVPTDPLDESSSGTDANIIISSRFEGCWRIGPTAWVIETNSDVEEVISVIKDDFQFSNLSSDGVLVAKITHREHVACIDLEEPRKWLQDPKRLYL